MYSRPAATEMTMPKVRRFFQTGYQAGALAGTGA